MQRTSCTVILVIRRASLLRPSSADQLQAASGMGTSPTRICCNLRLYVTSASHELYIQVCIVLRFAVVQADHVWRVSYWRFSGFLIDVAEDSLLLRCPAALRSTALPLSVGVPFGQWRTCVSQKTEILLSSIASLFYSCLRLTVLRHRAVQPALHYLKLRIFQFSDLFRVVNRIDIAYLPVRTCVCVCVC